jgi:glutamate-ammonia-ligase adenylyltransferase
VWEHQAITRARFCAGKDLVGKRFDEIREHILRQPRDISLLRLEVLSMRQKMHEGHPNNTNLFDIKHDIGGMVDIEFIVQFLVLAYAAEFTGLTDNCGNIALLQLAAKLHLVDQKSSESVSENYRNLRKVQHQLRLNNQTLCLIEQGIIDTTAVTSLWHKLLGN